MDRSSPKYNFIKQDLNAKSQDPKSLSSNVNRSLSKDDKNTTFTLLIDTSYIGTETIL
jgi:hypothetical protein